MSKLLQLYVLTSQQSSQICTIAYGRIYIYQFLIFDQYQNLILLIIGINNKNKLLFFVGTIGDLLHFKVRTHFSVL